MSKGTAMLEIFKLVKREADYLNVWKYLDRINEKDIDSGVRQFNTFLDHEGIIGEQRKDVIFKLKELKLKLNY